MNCSLWCCAVQASDTTVLNSEAFHAVLVKACDSGEQVRSWTRVRRSNARWSEQRGTAVWPTFALVSTETLEMSRV